MDGGHKQTATKPANPEKAAAKKESNPLKVSTTGTQQQRDDVTGGGFNFCESPKDINEPSSATDVKGRGTDKA